MVMLAMLSEIWHGDDGASNPVPKISNSMAMKGIKRT